jgi:hypothetical protein
VKETEDVKTYQQALEVAGLDREVGMDELVDKRIIIRDWNPDAKIVPQTKARTQGYMVRGEFVDDGEQFRAFIGGTVLVKELTALVPPFSTVIRRSGQTYRFS